MLSLLALISAFSGFFVWKQMQSQQISNHVQLRVENQTDINVAIKDKKFPVLHVHNKKVKLHESIDPSTWIEVEDEYDQQLPVTIYGEVDVEKKGVYFLKYEVSNRYGLKSSKTIQVIVE